MNRTYENKNMRKLVEKTQTIKNLILSTLTYKILSSWMECIGNTYKQQ